MWRLPEIRWAAFAAALFAAGALTQLAGAPAWTWWTLYLACYLAGGWEPALAGLRALSERSLDVDLLMVVAATGAAAIGQVFDGALLIVIFATSGALEAFATRRTEDSVRSLLDLAPPRATLLTGDGGEQVVDTATLRVGDLVLVRPGERIGADGLVVGGESEADQSTITGEPLPAAKAEGDEVFAGTLNGPGTLTVKVARPAGETVVARIVAMVEEAAATKAPTQLFVERIEQRYSVGVVVATLAVFGVPLLFGADLQAALLRAMTFMIVASPCAVVLATMPPLLAAIANAGRRGVLVKSAVVMERLGTATTVAFDKTGTLTTGVPRLAGVHPEDGFERDGLLALAAGAEYASEHPLGRAVVAAARAEGIAVPPATGFAALPGRGVRARVGAGLVEVGSVARLGDAGTAAGDEGATAVVVRIDGRQAGVLEFADRARSDAASAVARLRAVTGRSPVLLTGDASHAAQRLAADVGISEVRAGLLPEDKVSAVRALESEGQRVLVVGDGVNDAPALAAAHAGIAMGQAGADVTLETSDAVIVRDRLDMVPEVIELSRRARRFVLANLVLAGTFIVVLVTWDLAGHLPLPLGVAGHEGSTILVALNGLRLLRTKRAGQPNDGSRSNAIPTRMPE